MEPIAVIGFAFKLPGESSNENSLWQMLETGQNVSKDWPATRLNLGSFHDTSGQDQHGLRARGGHFLAEDPAAFDAPFFSITAKEAAAMDPQQRFMLETAYLALENAGIPMNQTSGSQTGLYEASMADDYSQLIYIDPDTAPRSAATGTAKAMLANRVSWYFNLLGPSLHIDTACSGSMVALDLACSSLRNGDCTMALAAGSNLMLSPVCSTMLSRMNFLSPDSLCYSFDHRANGYARGEGIIVMVLKRLSDALEAGDTIRALIRSSGTNQDGRTPGLTQPSARAQELLIRSVYAKANLDFSLTRYVEAHGTGTPVGDPIEMQAIGRVFQTIRSRDEPLYVGSIKANIGHLEGGSGLAGVLKAIMMLERGWIPPNANFEKPNPDIDFDLHNVKIPTELTQWPTQGLRRISVNSFGFGGTNAHVVLDDAKHYLNMAGLIGNTNTLSASLADKPDPLTRHNSLTKDIISTAEDHRLLVFSAVDEKSLNRTRENIVSYCRQRITKGLSKIDDLAFTLSERRSDLLWRSFSVVTPSALSPETALVASKPQRSSQQSGIAFMFTGQGAEYPRMGLELVQFPVFKATLERTDGILSGLGCTWSILDELRSNENINQPRYSQLLCTVLQIALVDLLESLNVKPVAVIGHSSGEIAAAYCAGAVSIESACKIAFYRGILASKLIETSPSKGAMMSVNLDASSVPGYIERVFANSHTPPDLTVACINSPKNVTISGDNYAIDVLKVALEHDQVFTMKLSTGIAYHSSAMRAVAAEYAELIGTIEPCLMRKGNIPMVSSVTGKSVRAATLSTASYWVQNLLSPVLFESAMKTLLHANDKIQLGMPRMKIVYDLVEIGPHGALRRPCQDILEQHSRKADLRYTSVLSRNMPATKGLLHLLGSLYAYGYHVAVTKANQRGRKLTEAPRCLVDLPRYPFDHTQTYWHESRISRDYRLRGEAPKSVLGVRCVDWTPLQPRWRKFISTREMPWVADHVVSGNVIYPGAGMIIMALEASKQSAVSTKPVQGFVVKQGLFLNPMVLRQNIEEEKVVEVICQLKPLQILNGKDTNWSEVSLSTFHDGAWSECFRCTIQLQYDESHTEIDGGQEKIRTGESAQMEYDSAVQRCVTPLPSASFYTYCAERGISYGPSFSILKNIQWSQDGTVTGCVDLSQPCSDYDGIVHPAIVDAACQACWLAPSKGLTEHMPTEIPLRVSNMYVAASGWKIPHTSSIRVCTSARFKEAGKGIAGAVTVLADDGTLLCKIGNLELSPIADDTLSSGRDRMMLHSIQRQSCLSLLTPTQVSEEMSTCELNSSIASTDMYSQKLVEALHLIIRDTLLQMSGSKPECASPHLQRYSAWLQNVKEDDHITTSDISYEAILDAIDIECPAFKVHTAIARNLPQILRGEVDPLQTIFTTNLAERFYAHMFQQHCDSRFTRLLDLISFEEPRLKILEVGAGTGSMTSYVLAALQAGEKRSGGVRFAQYTYTDISHAFFDEAKAKFKEFANRMEFRVLDLEKDMVEQGYGTETYDLVVAGAVLHTTQSLQATLESLRPCLKPGGKLLFLENVLPDLALQFSFGTLSGWWRGTESWRVGSQDQYTCESQWHKLLQECGFSGNDVVLGREDSKTFSIIMSTAVARCEKTIIARRILLYLDSTSDVQVTYAQAIDQSMHALGNYTCTMCGINDIGSVDIDPSDVVIVLFALRNCRLRFLTEVEFRSLQTLMQNSRNILWLTETNAEDDRAVFASMSTGFLRAMRSEATNSRIISLALEKSADSLPVEIGYITAIFRRSFEDSCSETEYFVDKGKISIARLQEEHSTNKAMIDASYPRSISGPWTEGPALMFDVGIRGTLDSLRFIHDPVYYTELGPNDVELNAQSWGLNFRDVFNALGRLDETDFGLDTAGYVTKIGSHCSGFEHGDRVVILSCGSFRMFPRADQRLVVRIPDAVSFEDATSLLAPAITAYYCLYEVARLRKGERVLIHSAAGATGQLAVQLALSIGAEVFATVSNNKKREMLKSVYGLPHDHIFYSRNTTFSQGVLRMTDHQGVDVVLNSLAGDALRASWECIAPFGRFIEIGKADIMAGTGLPMSQFAKNVSFSAVDLRHILSARKNVVQELIKTVMRMFDEGEIVCPYPLHLYPISAVEDAFRFLQSGKNDGRIVVHATLNDVVPKFLATRPTWSYDSNSSYIIAGGLGGIGRAVCRWMAHRGVRNLILPSRSGPREKAAQDLITELQGQGVIVVAPLCDVGSAQSLSELLVECKNSMPPIKGCINAAMVLQDAIFEHMSHDQWESAVRAKVETSWNLHKLFPSGLDFFILLSSLAGVFGNVSQANYAAGNTFQDALAHYRTARGEQTISINLGWMRTIGIISEKEEYQSFRMKGADMAKIEEKELMALLDIHCDPAYRLPSPSGCQILMGTITPADLLSRGSEVPDAMMQPLFSTFAMSPDRHMVVQGGEGTDAAMLFKQTDDASQREKIVANALAQKLARSLSMAQDDIDHDRPLFAYGVDSLVAVELRNWVGKEFGADVTVFDIMGGATVTTIGILAVKNSSAVR